MRTLWAVLCVTLLLGGCSKPPPPEDDTLDPQKLLDRLNADRRRHDPRTFAEVDLGEYSVTYRHAAKNQLLYIRFRIFGIVHEKQEEELKTAMEKRGKRMRDSVLGVVQRSEAAHLYDPNLDWLKSELIPMVNKVLQTRAVRDVVIPDFEITPGS